MSSDSIQPWTDIKSIYVTFAEHCNEELYPNVHRFLRAAYADTYEDIDDLFADRGRTAIQQGKEPIERLQSKIVETISGLAKHTTDVLRMKRLLEDLPIVYKYADSVGGITTVKYLRVTNGARLQRVLEETRKHGNDEANLLLDITDWHFRLAPIFKPTDYSYIDTELFPETLQAKISPLGAVGVRTLTGPKPGQSSRRSSEERVDAHAKEAQSQREFYNGRQAAQQQMEGSRPTSTSQKPVSVVEPDIALLSKNDSTRRKDNTHPTERNNNNNCRLSAPEPEVKDENDSKLAAPAPIVLPTPPQAKQKRKDNDPTSVPDPDSEPPSPKKPRRSNSHQPNDPEQSGHPPPKPQQIFRPATEPSSTPGHAAAAAAKSTRRISIETQRKAVRGELGDQNGHSEQSSKPDPPKSKKSEGWMTLYKRLVAYEKEHGNTRVPRFYKKDIKLGNWVVNQRHFCKKEDRIDLLNEIGFEWKVKERTEWLTMYRRLMEYKRIHGHTRVPQGYTDDPSLGKWVSNQRRYCKQKNRINLLNEIEFEWKSPESNQVVWMEMYRRLVAYKKEHGDTRVPVGYKENPGLGKWVSYQRSHCKGKNRIKLLNEIEFEWKPPESNREVWMGMYRRLVAYKQEHGDTRVPIGYEADPKLGNWVSDQHYSCKGKDRIKLLNEIEFEWKPPESHKEVWMGMYRRLVAYKKEHGNTRVPRAYKEDPKLGNWVNAQHYNCKETDRIDLLNEIDFEWKDVKSTRKVWMEMYRRLVAYKKEHGDTRVPRGYEADPKLANWVSCQRQSCKDKERVDLLNEIGFVWVAREREPLVI